jgi:hypothetical protein
MSCYNKYHSEINNKSFQLNALSAAKQKATNGRWWIKGDAFDIRVGLRQSLKNEWSGDTELGDGKLQDLKRRYDKRLSVVKTFGLGNELLRGDFPCHLFNLI